MSRWLIGTGPLGIRQPEGDPTRPVADFLAAITVSLVEQGDEVMLLFAERPPNAHEVPWLAKRGIAWRFWGDGRPTTLRHAATLVETLRAWSPDAAMFEFGGVSLGLPLAWAHRVPIRIARYLTAMDAMRHDRQVVRRTNIWRRRLVYRCATHIAVNARPLIDEVCSIFGVPPERVALQLQGVHRPARAPSAFEDRPRELVCVGRLAPTKGQHVLIEALARLKNAGIATRVHFVGDGDRAGLEARARALDVHTMCSFHGTKSRAEVYEFFTRYAIAVQPSLSDALPQSAEEAVVCGAVLVASNVGGLPDIIRDGESGLLVPPGRPDMLADALHRLLADEAYLQKLGRGAAHNSATVAMDVRAPLEASRLRRLVSSGPRPSPDELEIPHDHVTD